MTASWDDDKIREAAKPVEEPSTGLDQLVFTVIAKAILEVLGHPTFHYSCSCGGCTYRWIATAQEGTPDFCPVCDSPRVNVTTKEN